MRQLSLDEKISIKGKLARKGVLPSFLVVLTTKDAVWFFYRCFGISIANWHLR